MYKVGETDTTEEVMTQEYKFKAMLFFYGLTNLDMDNYLKI